MPEIDLFHLRITYREFDLDSIIDFIVKNADTAIIVHEVSKVGVPHIHCVLDGFTQTKSTFFQKLKKIIPGLSGNEHFSCEKKKDRKAQLRYVCKGTGPTQPDGFPDVRYFSLHETAITVYDCGQLFWKYYHTEYWKENSLLKAKSNEVNTVLQKDPSLVLKTKSKTWTDRTFDEIQEKCKDEIRIIRSFKLLYNASESEKRKFDVARAGVFELMIRCLGRGAKKMNNNILFDMFSGFLNGIYCLQMGDETDPVPVHSAGLYELFKTKEKFGN